MFWPLHIVRRFSHVSEQSHSVNTRVSVDYVGMKQPLLLWSSFAEFYLHAVHTEEPVSPADT